MNLLYHSDIQPFQGCNNQFFEDRGFTPTVIHIVPLRGTRGDHKSLIRSEFVVNFNSENL